MLNEVSSDSHRCVIYLNDKTFQWNYILNMTQVVHVSINYNFLFSNQNILKFAPRWKKLCTPYALYFEIKIYDAKYKKYKNTKFFKCVKSKLKMNQEVKLQTQTEKPNHYT